MFRHETKLLKELKHPNIIGLLATYIESTELWMVLELAAMNLSDYWMMTKGQSETEIEKKIKWICVHVIRGLEYIHNSKIVHLDLKPGNILLFGKPEPDRLVLSDFGISQSMAATTKTLIGGSPNYAAPELFDGVYSYSSDIYSFGMVLFFLQSRNEPWSGVTSYQIIKFMIEKKRPEVQAQWSAWSKSMIEKCWQPESSKRPTATQIRIQLESNTRCKAHELEKHTVFISYRVRYDAELAEKIALRIENQLLRTIKLSTELSSRAVYLDVECLNHGEDWTLGFTSGLRNSKANCC